MGRDCLGLRVGSGVGRVEGLGVLALGVGLGVGRVDGDCFGRRVGLREGWLGLGVGLGVGRADGDSLGLRVGSGVGLVEGLVLGRSVRRLGLGVGLAVGRRDGSSLPVGTYGTYAFLTAAAVTGASFKA